MPVIYSSDWLQDKARRLLIERPGADIIILKNSVMCYAFDASARAIWRVQYPSQRPRNRINLATADIQDTIDLLNAKGLSVYLCDLDIPLGEYVGRSLYAPQTRGEE